MGRKTSRSESSAAVCWYATRMSQPPQALPVDLSDVANRSDRRAATGVERRDVFPTSARAATRRATARHAEAREREGGRVDDDGPRSERVPVIRRRPGEVACGSLERRCEAYDAA